MAKTTHIRVDRKMLDEWNQLFPNVNKAELVKMAWETSALKLEGRLKQANFKNRVGKAIYGDMWKEE